MPAAARVGDTVLSPDGFGKNCAFPGVVSIVVGNVANVTANGLAIPVLGQPVPPHPRTGCVPDTSVLTTGSATVTIGGLPAARIGDLYGNNIITSGSTNVFIGG
jgi:uncharacterized Zn-binding protein involved in type VI secretion